MKGYVFESESENSITILIGHSFTNINKEHLASDSILIRTIEGIDYDDIMTEHHRLMGYEPYKPF